VGVGTGVGNFNAALNLSPAPGNDLFANRWLIDGGFYQTNGSFLGATADPGEPNHTGPNGIPRLIETLWWTWTAPTNVGVSSIPVSLETDAVSFPPNLAVYTGSNLAGLLRVNISSLTNGMSRFCSFVATAGTTYQIALGGEDYDT